MADDVLARAFSGAMTPARAAARSDTVASRVRYYRRLLRRPDGKQWTQEDLAEASGLDRRHIAKIEAGVVQQPEKDVLKKLADGLGVSLRDVAEPLGWWEDEPPPDDALAAAERAIKSERSLTDDRKQAALVILRDLFARSKERKAG